jgi:putative ABC transport system permease protein
MISWLRRLGWLLGRRRFEAELGEEIRIHQEMAAEQARHEGVGPDEAVFAARRRMGNRAQLAEAARDVWRPPALGDLGQDLRYALRGLRRQPGYAVAAALTLMLAIGATTALFSVLDALLLRPLPYREADRMVQVWEHKRTSDNRENLVSPANFLDWRDRTRSFEHLAAYTWTSLPLGGEGPAVIYGRMVTGNFFSVMGARPSLGRGFLPEDTLPGAPRALIVSHALWSIRFGGDSAILGKPVPLREGAARIVGVMPSQFRPLGSEEYWEPWPMQSDLRIRRGRYAMVVGRLGAGTTVNDADRELKGVAAALEREHPPFNAEWDTRVVSLEEQVTGGARPVLLLLGGAIASVLLIACLNVANLRLGQVLARRTELAVRTALGASRARLIRQMLAEGLVLAAIGGVLGTLAAMAGVRALVAAQVTLIPRLEEVSVSLRVLVFAGGLTALIGVAFGLAPALALREDALRQPLSRRGGETGSAPRARRLRGVLVSVQVALSLMLLAGASLSVRSLGKLLAVNPGFEPGGVLTVELELPGEAYATSERKVAFYETLVDRVRGIPGVIEVGMVNFLPLRGFTPGTSFQVVGRPELPPGQGPSTQLIVADPGYHATMGTPIVQGRDLTSADRLGTPRVILVNQAFARRAFPGADPVGQRVKVAYAEPDSLLTIVGVVADMRREGLDLEPRPMVVYPFRQYPFGYMTLVVRSQRDPEALVPAIRAEITALDRALPVLRVETLASRIRATTADRRYPMLLLSLLASLAVVLSAVGLYGVLAYLVGQRAREIGIRKALGASSGAVARLVLGEGFRFVLLGVAVGLVAALLTTRYLGALLYGLAPNDPLTLGSGALILLVVAAAAAWLPTRRALRVDPAVTLREDG